MIKKIGGRKFLLSILILSFSFSLIMFDKLDSGEYIKLVSYIIGLYVGFNFLQKRNIDE